MLQCAHICNYDSISTHNKNNLIIVHTIGVTDRGMNSDQNSHHDEPKREEIWPKRT